MWICFHSTVIQGKLKTSSRHSQLSVQLPPPSSERHKESYSRAYAGEQLLQEFGAVAFKSPLDSRSAGSSVAGVDFYRQPSTPRKEPETPDNNWLFAGSPGGG